METQILPSKYDGKHALNCLEQEIRQMQGGKITCKQKWKILLIEKELKALEIIKPLVDLTKENNHCWLWLGLNGRQITQEEYDLLKEILWEIKENYTH